MRMEVLQSLVRIHYAYAAWYRLTIFELNFKRLGTLFREQKQGTNVIYSTCISFFATESVIPPILNLYKNHLQSTLQLDRDKIQLIAVLFRDTRSF